MNTFEKTMTLALLIGTIIFVLVMANEMGNAHLQENLYKILRGVK